MTRAAKAMFLVGGRTSDKALDPGASTLAVVEQLATEHAELLAVEDVDVPAPAKRAAEASLVESIPSVEPRALRLPEWRVLPIAPTALADFNHCPRRFELVHLLGLPEHVTRRRAPDGDAIGAAAPPDTDVEGTARAHVLIGTQKAGTIAHAVLERLPAEAFLAADRAAGHAAVTRSLESAGVPEDHPQHAAIAGRAMRFLETAYARSIAERGATITREVAFVLPIEDEAGRAVSLRGSMDLVVVWPDGVVDVVDYKSARSGDTDSYAFQLDVYALAARARFPEAKRLRAGLAFLGAGTGEPGWRDLPSEHDVRARITRLGAELDPGTLDGGVPARGDRALRVDPLRLHRTVSSAARRLSERAHGKAGRGRRSSLSAASRSLLGSRGAAGRGLVVQRARWLTTRGLRGPRSTAT